MQAQPISSDDVNSLLDCELGPSLIAKVLWHHAKHTNRSHQTHRRIIVRFALLFHVIQMNFHLQFSHMNYMHQLGAKIHSYWRFQAVIPCSSIPLFLSVDSHELLQMNQWMQREKERVFCNRCCCCLIFVLFVWHRRGGCNPIFNWYI